MDRGHDQVLLLINNYRHNGQRLDASNTGSSRVKILDFSPGSDTSQTLYLHDWDDTPCQVCGWHDPGDVQLVGDFRGLGWDQALFINNYRHNGQRLDPSNTDSGRVMIRDFNHKADVDFGANESVHRYWLDWDDPCQFCGMHDPDDRLLVGRFSGQGFDLLMSVEGNGARLTIKDFTVGGSESQTFYEENRGDSGALVGWLDANDLLQAGTFMGGAAARLLSINPAASAPSFCLP